MKRGNTHTIQPFSFGPPLRIEGLTPYEYGNRFDCIGVLRVEKNGDASYLCRDNLADKGDMRRPPSRWVRVRTEVVVDEPAASVREDSGAHVGASPSVLQGEGVQGAGT